MTDPRKPSFDDEKNGGHTRRDTIKYLIAGSIAASCPVPGFAMPGAAAEVKLGSERNEICHQVRDGHAFKTPAVSARHDVVIIGGGPSGLLSAYLLRNIDFLLLEKEPRLGGNAISENWRGIWYSTGAAYQMDDDLKSLCREIGMPINPIRSVDAAIINDTVVPEFWKGGYQNAPYPDRVKKNWDRFFADMKKLDTTADAEKLDNMTFAELLEPYGAEITAFFDNFGPNNWGAQTHDTSALIGAQSVTWGGGIDPERYTWSGGLGRISLALEDALKKTAAARLRKEATVINVEQKGSRVHVTYLENGAMKTVAAKTAIIACPKFIGKKIVKGLDDDHLDAMSAMRYQPYLVVNVCFNEVVYNSSYDTNIPSPSPIVDFNVADWVINRDNKETKRPTVLTCYAPRRESERSMLLDDTQVKGVGKTVVDHLNTWFPGSRDKVEEVHIYRRGHPMYVSAPGVLTRIAPKIRKPMGNIFFAHSDSEGGISEYSSAYVAARRVKGEVMQALNRAAKPAKA